jgi:hypothetical protein
MLGRVALGEGVLQYAVYEMRSITTFSGELMEFSKDDEDCLLSSFNRLANRPICAIFEEVGIDPKKAIRSQTPKPLPDRMAVDSVIFNKLNMTNEERIELYWSLCEMVKGRLEKAESF